MKFLKIFQYAYIAFAILFIYEAIDIWSTDRNRAYLYLFLSVFAIFIFFFRKKYRKKFDDRQNQQ